MNIETRVQSVLADIEDSLSESRTLTTRGELALALARKLDDGTAGPSTAAISKELRAVLAELENITPDGQVSRLDEINLRRQLRLVDLLDEYDARVAAQEADPKSRRRRG